jgi:glutathione-regulated potassium-efflux system ancillary protein KefF
MERCFECRVSTRIARLFRQTRCAQGRYSGLRFSFGLNLGDKSLCRTDEGREWLPLDVVHSVPPYPERSIVNKALQNTAAKIPGVLFKNLEAIYGDNLRGINVEAERRAYEGIRRVVFMFPTHWFNLTPMLKAYLNEVWTVWAPGALNGKEMLVVTTTGADAAAYTHEGKIGLTIEEVLAPMRASANYTGMTYLKPLAFLGVTNASPEMIRSYQQALFERLAEGLSATR